MLRSLSESTVACVTAYFGLGFHSLCHAYPTGQSEFHLYWLVEKNEASSLTPTLVEALISQNWLRSKSVPFDIKENLDDLERFKAEMKDLPQAMSTLSVND
ncbi:hypothetical protein Tco_0813766 [Tanacetum coccineum]